MVCFYRNLGRNFLVVEHDYDILLVTGERIRSQSDIFFLYINEYDLDSPVTIIWFFTILQNIKKYTHVYVVTNEHNDLSSAIELIPLTAIAKFIKK